MSVTKLFIPLLAICVLKSDADVIEDPIRTSLKMSIPNKAFRDNTIRTFRQPIDQSENLINTNTMPIEGLFSFNPVTGIGQFVFKTGRNSVKQFYPREKLNLLPSPRRFVTKISRPRSLQNVGVILPSRDKMFMRSNQIPRRESFENMLKDDVNSDIKTTYTRNKDQMNLSDQPKLMESFKKQELFGGKNYLRNSNLVEPEPRFKVKQAYNLITTQPSQKLQGQGKSKSNIMSSIEASDRNDIKTVPAEMRDFSSRKQRSFALFKDYVKQTLDGFGPQRNVASNRKGGYFSTEKVIH